MKLGPLYLLKMNSWLGLMRQIQALVLDNERLKKELTELHDRNAEPATPAPVPGAMLKAMDGWVTHYALDGVTNGGTMPIYEDALLRRHMELVGGVRDFRVLELGPMEAAHTRILCEAGAGDVLGIEGFRKCFLKCLVAKEAFQLSKARFLYGDFCRYVEEYRGPKFDLVLARGVLYHQRNPAALIHDLGRISDRVFVWSQVADGHFPGGDPTSVTCDGRTYRGRFNNYGGIRNLLASYCGGVHDSAVWLYKDELKRCFSDAGFTRLIEEQDGATQHGPAVSFVAVRDERIQNSK